jgi:hypothetical protein
LQRDEWRPEEQLRFHLGIHNGFYGLRIGLRSTLVHSSSLLVTLNPKGGSPRQFGASFHIFTTCKDHFDLLLAGGIGYQQHEDMQHNCIGKHFSAVVGPSDLDMHIFDGMRNQQDDLELMAAEVVALRQEFTNLQSNN